MSTIEELVERQISRWEYEKSIRDDKPDAPPKEVLPIVTVSRQRGSSGSYIARRISEELDYAYIHRQIIDIICAKAGYRRRIVESLDGRVQSQINLWVEGILHDKYVDSSDYFKYLYHIITVLAHHGGQVLLGRGGNFVLTLNTGFHIRVVAPMKRRVEKIMEFANVDHKAAMDAIEESDKDRSNFIRSNFRKDINDPHYYDLVLNTGIIEVEDAVGTAATAIAAKFRTLRSLG
jgi:cytidylate kinase